MTSPRRRRVLLLAAILAALVLLAAGLVFVVDRDRLRDLRNALDFRPVAVFVGDSYTAGAGASDPGLGSAYLIAAHQGWRAVVLGSGGTGYITAVEPGRDACGLDRCPSYLEVIPQATEHEPDVVVVSGGRNEVALADDPAWTRGVDTFFTELRRALPDAAIIATSPIWDDDPAPAELAVMGDVVQRAVTAVGGTYVDLGRPLLGRPDLLGGDSVHPNDAGHAAIAAAFNAAY